MAALDLVGSSEEAAAKRGGPRRKVERKGGLLYPIASMYGDVWCIYLHLADFYGKCR